MSWEGTHLIQEPTECRNLATAPGIAHCSRDAKEGVLSQRASCPTTPRLRMKPPLGTIMVHMVRVLQSGHDVGVEQVHDLSLDSLFFDELIDQFACHRRSRSLLEHRKAVRIPFEGFFRG